MNIPNLDHFQQSVEILIRLLPNWLCPAPIPRLPQFPLLSQMRKVPRPNCPPPPAPFRQRIRLPRIHLPPNLLPHLVTAAVAMFFRWTARKTCALFFEFAFSFLINLACQFPLFPQAIDQSRLAQPIFAWEKLKVLSWLGDNQQNGKGREEVGHSPQKPTHFPPTNSNRHYDRFYGP